MTTEKKILIIAYYFPPLGSIGSKRTIRYVRNLQRFGWKPYVITPCKWAYAEMEIFWDPSEVEEMSNYAEIYRTKFIDITKIHKVISIIPYLRRYAPYVNRFLYFFPPGHCLGWLPFAYIKAKKVIEKHDIDVVYSTSAPYLAHIIAYLLKKSTGRPWVADLRDEWSCHPYRKALFKWQRSIDNKIERKCLSQANKIITVSNHYKQQFLKILQGGKKNIVVITNGYRKSDFENIPHNHRSEAMVVTYCGLFYGTRSPEGLIRAVTELIDEGIIKKEKIRINFVGPQIPNLWQTQTSGSMQQVFNWVGFVSHETAIKYMMNSDLLCYISSGRGKGNIQGKVFEYIATGKSIFIIAEEIDEGIKIIEESQAKVGLVNLGDHIALKQTISDLYDCWTNGLLTVTPNFQAIERYEDMRLTQKMSSLLDEVITRKPCIPSRFIENGG